ncbi:MAG: thiamine phosphate synthase [Chloroflexi bacterium]|nr:thiamine phosphate synthase [Chloroflexota bacterium]
MLKLTTYEKEPVPIHEHCFSNGQGVVKMTSPQSTSRQTLRIIDANLNRVGEGLRLLEEIARLLLNDSVLTQQLKTMRHDLIRGDYSFQQQLLQSRDSTGDVGADMEVPGEEKGRELPLVLVANSRRVQESLRTLEEMAKLPGMAPELDSNKFKHARFDIYTIEQKLLGRLLRQDKLKHISGLYVIIDTGMLKGRSHLEVARQVISGGARTIQLRDKVQSKGALLPVARQLRSLCAEHGVLFIMNDYLDLALAVDADGLHVGWDDLPAKEARKLLPIDKILGVSANTVELALAAQSDGADYLGVGSMYPTATKEAIAVVGPERLRQIKQAVSVPLVAIGGISKDNASQVMAAGADAVAVISAISSARSPEAASRQIVASLEISK